MSLGFLIVPFLVNLLQKVMHTLVEKDRKERSPRVTPVGQKYADKGLLLLLSHIERVGTIQVLVEEVWCLPQRKNMTCKEISNFKHYQMLSGLEQERYFQKFRVDLIKKKRNVEESSIFRNIFLAKNIFFNNPHLFLSKKKKSPCSHCCY